MNKKTIQDSIKINASKEKLWQILTEQPYLNDWTSAFMSGSNVKGEFKEGAQILYLDPSGIGVVGKVSECKPNKSLKVSILAEVRDGKPDFDHPDSKRWEGSYDHYQITENDGGSTLSLDSVFPAEFYDDFVQGWKKMLVRFKELAEK